ncbi:MAG: hypothetical protein ABI418_01310 [Jatrophihabitantaceae bacterium]
MRLVIVGGGGFRVPLVHRELARRPELPISQLVLTDLDQARLRVIRQVIGDDPRVSVADSLAEAVRGADFVFSAIRVGGALGRVADERRALVRGVIGQETVGAGGLAYGLRTLPVALELARTVAELAPQAWLINFTNPAGLITEAMRDVLGDRVIGICDSPSGLIRRASQAAGCQPSGSMPTTWASTTWAGCAPCGSVRPTCCLACSPTGSRCNPSKKAGCSTLTCCAHWA